MTLLHIFRGSRSQDFIPGRFEEVNGASLTGKREEERRRKKRRVGASDHFPAHVAFLSSPKALEIRIP